VKISRIAQLVGGIGLAAAGMIIFFQKVDVHKLGKQLVSCNPLTIVLCIALALLTIAFRAWRWNIMIPDMEKTTKRGLFSIVAVGFMVNNILPARLGEAARVVLLWKKNGYSPAFCVGSIVIERIFDTLAFMSCFFVPVFLLDTMKTAELGGAVAGKSLTLQLFAGFFCAIFLIMCAMVFLYSQFPIRLRGFAKKMLRFVPRSFRGKAQKIGAEILLNLNWIFSIKKVAIVVMHTYLMMLCYAGILFLVVNAPGFTVLHGFFSQSFAAMGAAIPLSPGYVGTLHAVLLQGLLLCGVDHDRAIAATLLYHGIPYIPITALGLFYYFRMRISLKEISEANKNLNA
jgi:glycosyltransferase 2 family protein